MLNQDLPPQSVIDNALRQAISDVLHDPEFIRSLAEKVADALDGYELQKNQIRLEEVRNEFQKGLNSGRGNSVENVFDRLEAKYTAMITGSGV